MAIKLLLVDDKIELQSLCLSLLLTLFMTWMDCC